MNEALKNKWLRKPKMPVVFFERKPCLHCENLVWVGDVKEIAVCDWCRIVLLEKYEAEGEVVI